MKIKRLFLLLITGALLTNHCIAENRLQWQDNSLSYLYGSDFKVDPSQQQTVTFEHFSGWSWGDLFWTADYVNFNGGVDAADNNSTYYTEVSPRLSLAKLSGQELAFGAISDVLLTATYEQGRGGLKNYLLGPAIDLTLPGFDFFQLNVYYRHADTGSRERGVWQITPVWSNTWNVGRSTLWFIGYIDWVVDSDDSVGYQSNFHFNPQLNYDLGKLLGWRERQLLVGIDYDYWTNKYGIKDGAYGFTTHQRAPSIVMRAHF